MPIPERVMGYRSSDEMNMATWLDEADIKLVRCLWPRKCYQSGKWLFLKESYKTTRTWTGPGEPVHEHRWYDKNIFILLRIKYSI